MRSKNDRTYVQSHGWSDPRRKEYRLTRENLLAYLRCGPQTVTGIRFGFNTSHGIVHSKSAVNRVLASLARDGLVRQVGETWFASPTATPKDAAPAEEKA